MFPHFRPICSIDEFEGDRISPARSTCPAKSARRSRTNPTTPARQLLRNVTRHLVVASPRPGNHQERCFHPSPKPAGASTNSVRASVPSQEAYVDSEISIDLAVTCSALSLPSPSTSTTGTSRTTTPEPLAAGSSFSGDLATVFIRRVTKTLVVATPATPVAKDVPTPSEVSIKGFESATNMFACGT